MNRSIPRALALLAGLALAPAAVAGTLRCDGELFDDGNREGVYKQRVLKHCGERDLRKAVQFGADGQLQHIEDRM